MTELLPADAGGIALAAATLRAGGLVAFPTETVYGLGADATNPLAVARVFEAKGRPRFNPLICHFPAAASAFAEVRSTPLAEKLADAFWPGPLTLVLPRRAGSAVATLASAGQDTLGIRVPAHPVALALLRASGRPVCAPSANRSGRVSPTTAAHVLDELSGRIDLVLDGGPCAVGVESTVVLPVGKGAGEGVVVLRPGGVTVEALLAVGIEVRPAADADGGPLRSPGLLASHYAPGCPLRLGTARVGADEALLAFGPPLGGARVVFQLSLPADLAEAAARLYDGLRALDAEVGARGFTGIAAMPVPERGLGVAINDRLRRAAAPTAALD